MVSGAETEIHDLKGKELFDRLHEIGTLAQVSDSDVAPIVLMPSLL